MSAMDVEPAVKTEHAATSSSSSSSSTGPMLTSMKREDNEVFAADENVLAFHGPLLYPAKVLKAEMRKEAMAYFVHYNGWNKKWDEWVGSDRLLKYIDENISYSQELQQKSKKSEKAMAQDSKPSSKSNKGGSKNNKGGSTGGSKGAAGSKRRLDDDETIDDSDLGNEIKIKLPASLKKQLIVDWENITRKQLTVDVPVKPELSVASMLKEFVDSKIGKGDANESMTFEVATGLRNYFDRALGTILLYRFERPQYEDICKAQGDRPMSEIYGAEHLLRLFVKLPGLLTATKLDKGELRVLLGKVDDFLKYLDTRTQGSGRIFQDSNYKQTDKLYQDRYAQI